VIKRITLLLVVAIVAATMVAATAVPAFAANAPEGCYKDRGTIYCPTEGGPGKGQDLVQTESKKGSVNSSHDTQSECTSGAGGSGNCPSGQFKNTDSPLP
jgi:hypothetical protein